MWLDARHPEAIAAAAQALGRGELVALPTETVYGLAADADHPAAVARVFAAKGRPPQRALSVLVLDAQAAAHYARALPGAARRWMQDFWPGPLTLVVPRRAHAGTAAACGQDSIALRCPAHPAARAVLAACAQLPRPIHGLAAPSANRFGRISPTRPEHVVAELGADLLGIDGGDCPLGVESTIVDCTGALPVLLRPGALDAAALGLAPAAPAAAGPGLHATLCLMPAGQLHAALRAVDGHMAGQIAVWHRTPLPPGMPRLAALRTMPLDAPAAMRDLYAALRALDSVGAHQIWAEQPPDALQWTALHGRLRAMAAG